MRTNAHAGPSVTGRRHALMSGRTYGVVALAVLAAGSMTACDDGGDASATPTTSPTTSTTGSPTPGAPIEWESCTERDLVEGQCASLEVPVDYDDPTGASIDIFVFRTPARGTRLGTLIVNPGGPGASAVDFVRDRFGSFPAGFDVVAFDPRGVGRSHPVVCLESSDVDTLFTGSLRPADDAELADWLAEAEQTADAVSPPTSAPISAP
jgi:pimeloyl-ACP methyl ester carboxylesterase